jgi:GT2 family glycosyltransferase
MVNIVYSHPPQVALGRVQSRPVLVTAQGGKIALDEKIANLWELADNRCLTDILAAPAFALFPRQQVQAALACLAEAGLLTRWLDLPLEVQTPANMPGDKPVAEKSEQPFVASSQDTSLQWKSSQPTDQEHPLVSAIIVSCNSRPWLEKCLLSLISQTHPSLEIIVVDNHSEDESVAFVSASFPLAKLVALPARVSLAAAINAGVAASKGSYFLILNPDVYLDARALEEMLSVAQSADKVAGVAAKLRFSWAPAFLNGIGNRVGAFSWGSDNALGHLDLGQFDDWTELPSLCFAAALLSRNAWNAVGELDEGYPLYYEDSDWSYRARLLGYHLLAAPKAIVYHAFGGDGGESGKKSISPSKLSNVVYGRYRFVYKIAGEKRTRFALLYLVEDGLNFLRFAIQRDGMALKAYLQGWRHFLRDRGHIAGLRAQIQATRQLGDNDLFALQRNMPASLVWRGMPELTWDIIVRYYFPQLERISKTMPELSPQDRKPSLLIVSHDIVDEKMAGPGMRYWEMAKALQQDLKVTLAVPTSTSLREAGIQIEVYQENSPAGLEALVAANEVALISGYMVEKFPFLRTTSTRLIVDVYTPMVLENFHYYLDEPLDVQLAANRHGVEVMNRLMEVGDFFICGNERQRDFWLGVLTANGRVNPLTYSLDSKLNKLIDIVGVGFPSQPPRHTNTILRGVYPNIPEDAKIVLWGGGLWNWLDPLTLVEAWPRVLLEQPQARLVFLGTRHPNPSVPAHEMTAKTIEKAEQIGEKDRTIFFIEWVSYKDRESLLLEADVGVTLHPIHAETRFSLRTRVLDYIWADLPVVITEGDVTSEWVQRYGIGEVAAEANPADVARALVTVLQRPKESYRPAFEPLKAQYSWQKMVKPVLEYCLHGDVAPDRKAGKSAAASPATPRIVGVKRRLIQVEKMWRTQGARYVLHRVWRYLQWRLSQP